MANARKAKHIGECDDLPLPPGTEIWAVTIDNKELNYGQVHEIIHRDIAIGNDYRKERIKLLTTLATGVFALTITFHKELFHGTLTRTGLCLMLLGWTMLLISLLAGIVHFRKWEDFYLEHRAQGNALWQYRTAHSDAGRMAARKAFHEAKATIDGLRESYRKWNIIQSGGLLAGMAIIAVYVGVTGFVTLTAEKPALGQAIKATGQQTSAQPPTELEQQTSVQSPVAPG